MRRAGGCSAGKSTAVDPQGIGFVRGYMVAASLFMGSISTVEADEDEKGARKKMR